MEIRVPGARHPGEASNLDRNPARRLQKKAQVGSGVTQNKKINLYSQQASRSGYPGAARLLAGFLVN